MLAYFKEVILDVFESKNNRKEHHGTIAFLQALFWIQKNVQTTEITEMRLLSLQPATWTFSFNEESRVNIH